MYESDNIAPSGGSTVKPLKTVVTRAELVRSAKLLGSGYAFEGAAPSEDEAVLEGRFETLRLRPGLILHAAAVSDLCDMRTHHQLHPGIKIVVVVDGATDLSFGPHRFLLGPQAADPGARARGALVNLAEAETFSRRWQRGRREGKVSLTLTREWLEQGGFAEHAGAAGLEGFARSHLASQAWTVPPRARELARQILEPSSFQPGLQRLRLESRCLELASEALAAVAPARPARSALSPADRRRLERLDELLHSDVVLGLGTAEIAREVGSNPTSLQALARRAWGCTVFERLRAIRLEMAHDLLARGASVAEAAALAGYASAPNFSTAFRQRYGFSPRQAKAA